VSYVLRYGGLLEEAASECEQAVSRDPTNSRFRSCVQPFMLLGRYERALDFVRLDSGSELSRVLTRLIYQRMGRREDARAQHAQMAPEYLRRLAPETFYGLLERCLSGSGPDRQGRLSDEDARTFLNEARRLRDRLRLRPDGELVAARIAEVEAPAAGEAEGLFHDATAGLLDLGQRVV
jgi:hypothetical protein